MGKKYFIPGYGEVDKIYCFAVSDFQTYEFCPFQFFVNHHLDKKYELADGNFNQTVGNLLDGAIKKYHRSGGQKDLSYIEAVLRAQYREYLEYLEQNSGPSFNAAMRPYLTEEALSAAIETFRNYYLALDGRIHPSIGEAKFAKVPIITSDGCYTLWGAADAYELGDDGMPEIVDYKYREDVEKGKKFMDMDNMPKIYTLLAADYLRSLGYKRARFIVRIWQDPRDTSLYEEFDLQLVDNFKDFFKQKIDKILGTTEVVFCEYPNCKACSHPQRNDFLKELEDKGFVRMSGEEFLNSRG